jgi:hypothetical protein
LIFVLVSALISRIEELTDDCFEDKSQSERCGGQKDPIFAP